MEEGTDLLVVETRSECLKKPWDVRLRLVQVIKGANKNVLLWQRKDWVMGESEACRPECFERKNCFKFARISLEFGEALRGFSWRHARRYCQEKIFNCRQADINKIRAFLFSTNVKGAKLVVKIFDYMSAWITSKNWRIVFFWTFGGSNPVWGFV